MRRVGFIVWPMVILSFLLLTACAEMREEGERTHAFSELWERIGKDPGTSARMRSSPSGILDEYARTGQPAYRQAAVASLRR